MTYDYFYKRKLFKILLRGKNIDIDIEKNIDLKFVTKK